MGGILGTHSKGGIEGKLITSYDSYDSYNSMVKGANAAGQLNKLVKAGYGKRHEAYVAA